MGGLISAGSLFLFILWATTALAGDRYALLIGVNKYQRMGKLQYCGRDAEALQKVLVDRAGFSSSKVVVLSDTLGTQKGMPTLGNIRSRIKQLTELPGKGDTLVIFFAGHGVMIDGKGYLLPIDGDKDPQSAIPLEWLKESMSKCPAEMKLLILDACHSGAARGVSGLSADLAKGPGLVVMASCGADQISYPDEKVGYGVFSRHLIEGLGGNADENENGDITCSELFGYVKSKMVDWSLATGKTQTPLLSGELTEDFVLASAGDRAPFTLEPFQNRLKTQEARTVKVEKYRKWMQAGLEAMVAEKWEGAIAAFEEAKKHTSDTREAEQKIKLCRERISRSQEVSQMEDQDYDPRQPEFMRRKRGQTSRTIHSPQSSKTWSRNINNQVNQTAAVGSVRFRISLEYSGRNWYVCIRLKRGDWTSNVLKSGNLTKNPNSHEDFTLSATGKTYRLSWTNANTQSGFWSSSASADVTLEELD